MKSTLLGGIAGVLLSCGMPAAAWGNAAPEPRPRPRPVPLPAPVNPEIAPAPAPQPEIVPNGRMIIEARDDVNELRLQIPREMYNSLAPKGKPEAKAADAGGSVRTVAAGIALTAMMVTGGLWLVRSGRAGGRVVAVLAVVCVGTAATVWANLPPRPPRPQPVPPIQVEPPAPVPVVLPAFINGPVLVEVVDGIKEVKLIVNRKMLAGLADKPVRIQPAEPIRPVQPIQPVQPR